jgi:hypothetical protein
VQGIAGTAAECRALQEKQAVVASSDCAAAGSIDLKAGLSVGVSMEWGFMESLCSPLFELGRVPFGPTNAPIIR